jgi:hypothetical protein
LTTRPSVQHRRTAEPHLKLSSGTCVIAWRRCSTKALAGPRIAKQAHGTTPDALPVHQFLQRLLADLATLTRNTLTTAVNRDYEFVLYTRPIATSGRHSSSSASTSNSTVVPSKLSGFSKNASHIHNRLWRIKTGNGELIAFSIGLAESREIVAVPDRPPIDRFG